MTKSLKQRAIRSGGWVIAGHFMSQLLRLTSNLILTRLLVPEMFGVMAIVTVLMGGLAMFSDVGLLQNIVQSKRGEEPNYLNTAWTIQIIRGFLIFLLALMFSGALYFAGQAKYLSPETVYGDSQLPMILAVVSITAMISGFNSIHLLVLNRKLMMNKLIMIELSSQVIGLIFMVVWAWIQRDIWALVFGGLISATVKMLLSHTTKIGERCRIQWEKNAVYDIIHFGKWIFLSSIFGFLLTRGDKLLLGGFINPEILGIYTIAFFLANTLKGVISKLLSSIFFPVLSEVVRHKSDNVINIYYSIRLRIDLATMPLAGFLYATGSVIITLLYDNRYGSAGWMLEVLSLSLISIGWMMPDQLFLARGNPKDSLRITFVLAISLYVLVPLSFLYFGLQGAVWAIALNPLLRIFVSMVIMKRYYFLNVFREVMLLPLVPIGYLIGKEFKTLYILFNT